MDRGFFGQGSGADQNALTSGESTVPRLLTTTGSALTTGSLRLTYFTATKTETITQIRVSSSTSAAAATPTLVRFGFWTAATDGSLTALVASTANDTALLAATNTLYTKALQASWSKEAGQRYAFGALVVSGVAAGSLASCSLGGNTALATTAPRLAAVSTQSDLPASIALGSLSNWNQLCYAEMLP